MKNYGMDGKTILVIGATGFIGSHLASALSLHGARVICVSRNIARRQNQWAANTVWHECDASRRPEIADVIAEFKPATIYHLTSDSRGGRELTLIPDSLQNDLVATTNVLLEAVDAGGIHVITTGSFEEPASGTDVPCSPYAAAKAATTSYARMISALGGLKVSILRLAMVYGPGQKGYKVLPYVISRMHEGQLAELGSARRLLDWVYIDDVVDAFLRVDTQPWQSADPIDIGTGTLIRLRDCIELIGELMGKSDLLRFGAIEDRVLEREEATDILPAEQRLGWKPKTRFRDGIQATIDSFCGVTQEIHDLSGAYEPEAQQPRHFSRLI